MRRFPSLLRRSTLAVAAVAAAVAVAPATPSTAAAATAPADASAASAGPEIDGAGRILVTFRRGASAADAIADAGGRPLRAIASLRTRVLAVDDVAGSLAAYRDRPDVEWAGVDGEVEALHHVPD